MSEDIRKDKDLKPPQKVFEILSWAERGGDVTARDDQYEFPWLLDSTKICRRRGSRFRLIDSGRFECSQLEWLAKAGADLYTSDEARPKASELELISKVCRSAGGFLAYFHHGSIDSKEEEGEAEAIGFSELTNLGRRGIFLHLTNKEHTQNFPQLNSLAFSCQKGGSWLVYYHHGQTDNQLEDLSRNGAWIHISDRSLQENEDVLLLLDSASSAREAGTNLVLHLDKGLSFPVLRDIVQSGMFVLFDYAHLEENSPLKALKKRKLDFRAYYLYPHFLP